MRILRAIVALASVLPSEAFLRGDPPGMDLAKGRELTGNNDDELCSFSIDSTYYMLNEVEIQHWKNCTMGAMAMLGDEVDADDEPILISQGSADDRRRGNRRLGKRSGSCRRCRSRRRRLTENETTAHDTYMASCLQSDTLEAFLEVTDYTISGCEAVSSEVELVTLSKDGAEPDEFCETSLINTGTFMDGELAMATYDRCFVDEYNCYHKTLDIHLEASEITAQHFSIGLDDTSGGTRSLTSTGETINIVDTKKQTCSVSASNTVLPQCSEDARRRALANSNSNSNKCRVYNGDIPPLQDWICDCLKESGHPAFAQNMTCHITCTGPVMTASEFQEQLNTWETNFKSQQDADKKAFEQEQAYEQEVFDVVLHNAINDYTVTQMTACASLQRKICYPQGWRTNLHVYEIDDNDTKFKGRFIPTQCRQLDSSRVPLPDFDKDSVTGEEGVYYSKKLGARAVFPKDYDGPTIKDLDFKKKITECRNDWNFGEPECSPNAKKSQVELFVYVANGFDAENNMEDDSDFKDKYESGEIMAKLEAYDNKTSTDIGDYCYFLYEIDCECNALES